MTKKTDPALDEAAVVEAPRNEMHDSYDPLTGSITAEAAELRAELRAEHGILAAGEQIPDTAPEADAG